MIYLLLLVASLGVILVGCAIFTNGIEWLGKKLEISSGATGSVLAAIGTALPETIIPVIALVSGREKGMDVAVGAIAGAPFMLATLALFVNGAAVYYFAGRGRRGRELDLDVKAKEIDLAFFLAIYSVAVLTTFVPAGLPRYVIASGLALSYFLYVRVMLRHQGEGHGELDGLYLAKMLGIAHRKRFILLQVMAGLGVIVLGAHYFVVSVQEVSRLAGVPTVLLALIITPIATELPEKVNSVLWLRDGKDTLALGNITGAMVFQSSFPVAIGVAFTAWDLTGPTMVSAVIALSSAALCYAALKVKKKLPPQVLLACGGLYLLFICYLFI